MTRQERSPHALVRRIFRGSQRGPALLAVAVALAFVGASSHSQSNPARDCQPGDPCQPCGTGVAAGVPCVQPPAWPAKRQIGGCRIQDNKTGQVLAPNAHGDPLFRVLYELEFCPENALQFRDLLLEKGLDLSPSQVANRGRNNPLPQGSFSFFEAVTGTFEDRYGELELEFGDFFFGHFQAAFTDQTTATSILSPINAAIDQNLLFESVVWDPRKGAFNFYEIIADDQTGVWYYRGDSYDILADIRKLYRNFAPGELLWGDEITDGVRLRCSGCHVNGGPIMKELSFPYDSWYRKKRPLPLGSLRIAPELQPIFAERVDAREFSQWIRAGVEKLITSEVYWEIRSELSLQEQLRPLFCEQEVNLASDTEPFERPNYDGLESVGVVRAPIGFFLNPYFTPEIEHVVIDYTLYKNALIHFDSLFLDKQAGGPRPTDSLDKDHGFETPVKAWSDMRLVAEMVEQGLVDDEFVADVLAVDMTRPMFSERRCAQLRLIPTLVPTPTTPEEWREVFGVWRQDFEDALEKSDWPGSREMYENLKDPDRDAAFYRRQARELIAKVQANVSQQAAVNGYVRLLAQRRITVFHEQISQNPEGQIFEPDFRLIFPTMQLLAQDQNEEAYGGVRGQFWLDPTSGRVELTP